jgi:hypothetical protein
VELKTVVKNADVLEMTLEVVDDDVVLLAVFEALDLITAFELLSLPVWPSNVTSAFSDMQDRFAELKRASTRLGDSGMLKFDCALVRRRGMEYPSVTSDNVSIEVVVQPVVPPILQVEPVKPLMQIHEQVPPDRIDEPPFWHSVVALDWHCCSWTSAAEEVDFCLWTTRSSTGTTTAAAMTIRMIRSTRRKPHIGRPQQRRRDLSSFSSRAAEVLSMGRGHEAPFWRGVPTWVGVARPGGGKAASIPESVDCRR